MEEKLYKIWNLFYTFLTISPITFGGGYAMLSIIEDKIVKKYRWITEEDISNIFIVAQTLPGAVAINSAIFIGYRVAGFIGAIFSLLGILLPTLTIVVFISYSFLQFNHHPIITSALNGIGAAVVALILHAGYTIGKHSILDYTTLLIAILTSIILFFFSINPIFLIIAGSIYGIAVSKIRILYRKKYKKKEGKMDEVHYKRNF